MDSFVESSIADIRKRVGSDKVICALSGGVDSAVAATLVSRAVGEQLTCIFVDHGLLRKNEAALVVEAFVDVLHLNVDAVDARERFLRRLDGVADPEEKRIRIGHEFIAVFEEEAAKIPGVKFLVQGTLYPDVIESKTPASKDVYKRQALRRSDLRETGRKSHDRIAVRHPCTRLSRHPRKQWTIAFYRDEGRPVLRPIEFHQLAAGVARDQLHPVTDAEQRHAAAHDRRIHAGRVGHERAFRTAAQNERLRLARGEFIPRRIVRNDLAVHVEFAHAARD